MVKSITCVAFICVSRSSVCLDSLGDWLMIAFLIIWISNLVPLLQGLCTSNPCRIDFSFFVFLPELSSIEWLPDTAEMLYFVAYVTANPTWGDIFECCFEAQSSKRLFSLKCGKRDVRALIFKLSKISPQEGLAVHDRPPQTLKILASRAEAWVLIVWWWLYQVGPVKKLHMSCEETQELHVEYEQKYTHTVKSKFKCAPKFVWYFANKNILPRVIRHGSLLTETWAPHLTRRRRRQLHWSKRLKMLRRPSTMAQHCAPCLAFPWLSSTFWMSCSVWKD